MATKIVNRTPLKSIRAKCLDCCCQVREEVEKCTIKDCALYKYRMGTRDAEATIKRRKARTKKSKE